MLRKIRITLAVVFFACITLLLLDFTGTLQCWLGWMARIQFLPAVLALNAVVIVALVLLTLIFGRIYCSVICPLGVMQDIVAHFHSRRHKNRYTYSRAKTWLRVVMLAVMVVALVAGFTSLAGLLAPYSSYGRMVTNLLQPLYIWCNNALAAVAEHYESYAFYSKEVWLKSLPTFIVALVTFIVVAVLAWRGGRTYCNTICPVGTVLGYVARFSWFKVHFDADKCRSCSLCTTNCKASCIDHKTHTVDYTRCVACGNCLDKCKFGALHYGHAKRQEAVDQKPDHTADEARRAFLVGGAIVAADVALAQAGKKVDGGLAVIEDKRPARRTVSLTPPGSGGAAGMARHCTACQLCVAQCPNDVLRPSTDLKTFMQPTLSYERGFCRPECTRCSQVCPTGAIRPIDVAQKTSIQVGHAVWVRDNCVILADGVECGNCARHCPSEAIMMGPSDPNDDLSPMVPAVDRAKCIGCGACEYVCPARPFSAIYVEGNEQHSSI
ncbi:MAG: 4Fe-4S dicluster domain-containing protein [Muribaculaceae bacterium]|nr:4Fe-4S dicluster domain-containing protein [Muribaculaceae bacterium]